MLEDEVHKWLWQSEMDVDAHRLALGISDDAYAAARRKAYELLHPKVRSLGSTSVGEVTWKHVKS